MQSIALPTDIGQDGAVGLQAYQRAVRLTDHLPADELETPMLGFFGEVGSLLTVVKKQRRDFPAYPGYKAAILEEFGDVLWYFTTLVDRAGLDLSVIAQRVSRDLTDWDIVEKDEFGTWGDIQTAHAPVNHDELSRRFAFVASLAGELVSASQAGRFKSNRDRLSGELVAILSALIAAAEAANISLDHAARGNLQKVFSRYPLDHTYPPAFDGQMPLHEQLPPRFEVKVEEHFSGSKTWVTQTINGSPVGDPLTDNKIEADDYRYHDVFHLAYAVHLGWSPILRRLLKLKRKSVPVIDENEDGARAAIIEEGIATFIFGRALERNFFQGLERLDFDLLKFAHNFVRGFEAERCSFWQWERAILDGFRMFRALKVHRSGIVKVDLIAHTLEFQPLPDSKSIASGDLGS